MIGCDCAAQGKQCLCTPEDCGCEVTRAKLEDLLRNELCDEESAPIREHLRRCPDCRAEQEVCVSLTEAIRRGCQEKAPERVRDTILEQLKRLSQ